MVIRQFARILLGLLIGSTAVPSLWAQTYTVLYSFTGGEDGASPKGSLVIDSAGNLYGTTLGANQYPYLQTTGTTAGSIFKLGATGDFTLLYNFGAGGANGSSPSGGLVRDSAGNLYGATSGGGSSTNPNCFAGGFKLPANGCGVIFKVDATGKFSVLYNFSGDRNCWRGCEPLAPLTLDAAGNLYGTTHLGGSRDCHTNADGLNNGGSDCGVVFKLDTKGKEIVLHRFGKARRDGDFPNPGLILDAAGKLYGTTFGGGRGGAFSGGSGTLFTLDTTAKETVLYYFPGSLNSARPNGGLIQDAAGNFFGTTRQEAFKLDPQGNLTELSVLEGLTTAPLLMDSAGNMFGNTIDGGISPKVCGYFADDTCGTIFKLFPSGTRMDIYSFNGGVDGDAPYAGLVMDAAGNLYGTTPYGGTVKSNCPAGCGVVFKITP